MLITPIFHQIGREEGRGEEDRHKELLGRWVQEEENAGDRKNGVLAFDERRDLMDR